jgi:hypothetical protein
MAHKRVGDASFGTRSALTGRFAMGWRRAGAAVALSVFTGVVVTACSGATGHPSGSPAHHGNADIVATFTPVHAGTSTQELVEDAKELTVRLGVLGDHGASAAVRGRSVVVSGGAGLPVPISMLIVPGTFQIRPVLCQAGPYTPTAGSPVGPLPTACSSGRYSLQAPNLTVDTTTGTSNLPSIQRDPTLASYPSSTPADNDSQPGSFVLLPAPGTGGMRYLLGPSELNGMAVASAHAIFESPQWIVNVTLTREGAPEWDALARMYFHELIGIDVDGQAVSVPITQPNSSSFTPFAGRMQISGPFDKRSSEVIAADLDSGPLTAPLRVTG